jgi:hypothetical protein
VQKILRKGALVFLQFEIVFVFREILGHGDELVPDVVPPIQHFLGSRARWAWSLILRFASAAKTHSQNYKQKERKQRKSRSPRTPPYRGKESAGGEMPRQSHLVS